MNIEEGVEASPDSEDEHDDDTASKTDETELPAVWYAVPTWRLWLFSLVGGAVYQAYWMYRCWHAFRASMGYSERARWLARYQQNGFRPSAFWRAALFLYSYCWLAVVRREARSCGVKGFGPPWLWFGLQLFSLSLPWGWNLLGLSLAFLPVQLTMNRLHDQLSGNRAREPVTASELCWLALGLLLVAKAAAELRALP